MDFLAIDFRLFIDAVALCNGLRKRFSLGLRRSSHAARRSVPGEILQQDEDVID